MYFEWPDAWSRGPRTFLGPVRAESRQTLRRARRLLNEEHTTAAVLQAEIGQIFGFCACVTGSSWPATGRSGKPKTASRGSTPTASACSPRSSAASSLAGSPRPRRAATPRSSTSSTTSRTARSSDSRRARTAPPSAGAICRAACSTMSEEDKQHELRDLVRHYGQRRRRQLRSARLQVRDRHRAVAARLRVLADDDAARGHGGAAATSTSGSTPTARSTSRARAPSAARSSSRRRTRRTWTRPRSGFGLMRAGLPPTTYGAGKNLFTNPFISFFMRNLGAYRVDRRLRFELYKDVLKEYSTVLLEHGYHSLFFPGGTRSPLEPRREAPQARPARHDGHRVQEPRPRGHAEQAASTSCRRRSTTGSCSRPRR